MKAPKLTEVFIIHEANVTTLAQMNKVPIEVAKYVNDKDRQNADILLSTFALNWRDDVETSLEKDSTLPRVDAWLDAFDKFYKLYGNNLSVFLKNNPAKKKEVSDLTKKNFREIISFLKQQSSADLSKRSVLTFPDGYYWVKLDGVECGLEGDMMQHCGAVGDGDMYSLRDKSGKPHVTIELEDVGGNPVIWQVRGKQNTVPDKKYWDYIAGFTKKMKVNQVADMIVLKGGGNQEFLSTTGLRAARAE